MIHKKKKKKVNICCGRDTLFCSEVTAFSLNPAATLGSQVVSKPCLKIEMLPACRFGIKRRLKPEKKECESLKDSRKIKPREKLQRLQHVLKHGCGSRFLQAERLISG